MQVLVTYHWENVVLNVEKDTGGISPHTRPEISNVDYDYYMEISYDDIIDYLIPSVLREEEAKIYRRAISHTLSNLNDYIDFDSLGEDEYFREYIETTLKDKYEDKARQEFEESNEAY